MIYFQKWEHMISLNYLLTYRLAMRKLVLATIMAAVFVSGTMVGMMPFANAAGPGADPIDKIVRRFTQVVNIVERANERYDQIVSDLGTPPSNDPLVVNALNSIKTSCQSLIGKVNTALGTTPPPP